MAVVAPAAALALCAAFPTIVAELDVVSSSYDDLDEARDEGAIERGWLPSFTPPSARDIAAIHDLDTNERCARLTVDPEELPSFITALKSAGFLPYRGDLPALPSFSPLRSCPFSRAEASPPGEPFRRPVPNTAEHDYVVVDPRGRILLFSALR